MRERELRAALINRITARGTEATRIVHELALPMLGARIDVAVIGQRLVGYEIKTANDTLIRLPQQCAAYGKVFDRMYLVAESRHIPRATETLPDWWGIVEARTSKDGLKVRWAERRSSRLNPAVDLRSLAELLWREELIGELENLGLRQGLTSASRAVLTSKLVEASPKLVSASELKSRVRFLLTNREDWRAA